ncbi:phenylacetate--CoA ligase family protein [Flavisphingomonas formosensis]|uniref:hypothetical protein n=1 Tax=Flavisphingomonas formosensis TaxID=861534 RepID=UPI0012FBBD95|nr:hypothetical protein [Sphingomonas formosensis]
MTLGRADLERLQLIGLRQRFEQCRESVPVLKRLADNQGIREISRLEDALPLLYTSQTYKSYPSALVDQHRFDQLTKWLDKLTMHDLSKVDVSGCQSIDSWMTTIKRETPLLMIHTSGTSGTMSFVPSTKREWEKFVEQFVLWLFGDPAELTLPLDVDCIYPYYRDGGWSHAAANDCLVKLVAGNEERFHAAYPGRLSSDLLLMGIRHQIATAKGEVSTFRLSPEVAARREEFEAQQRAMPDNARAFFETLCDELSGRRVFTQVTTSMLFKIAQEGLKGGKQGIFSPDSVIVSGGGAKGIALPPDWEETVKTFFGVREIAMFFGMSEMIALYRRCEHGHYHAPAWSIPYVLDIESGKPLPREGRQSGRFACYDLLIDSRWGGFISGDYVTMDWETSCACGRTGPHIVDGIRRVADVQKEGAGEDKISCALTPDAYEDALDFLNAAETLGG